MVCGESNETAIVNIKDGKYVGKVNGHTTHIIINDITYGDLNDDGKDEAIIQYMCGSGASGAYLGGLIYEFESREFTNIEGGDKGNGGLIELKIENGMLIVENNQSSQGHACCPDSIRTSKYKFKENKLILKDEQTYRKIPQQTELGENNNET